jgi:hypothetical protein
MRTCEDNPGVIINGSVCITTVFSLHVLHEDVRTYHSRFLPLEGVGEQLLDCLETHLVDDHARIQSPVGNRQGEFTLVTRHVE